MERLPLGKGVRLLIIAPGCVTFNPEVTTQHSAFTKILISAQNRLLEVGVPTNTFVGFGKCVSVRNVITTSGRKVDAIKCVPSVEHV